MLARPHGVLDPGLPPRTLGQRLGLERLQVVLHIQSLEHHASDRVVADGGEVQPIGRPHARVAELAQRPHVSDYAIVPVRDRPQILVVDRHLAAHPTQHRCHSDVGTIEHHHGRAVTAQAHDHVLESLGDVIRVGAGADDVVAASRHRDEVGIEREGSIDLLVGDLLEKSPPDCEIRIGEVGALRTEHLGHAIRPPAVSARALRFRVADALGE